MREVRAKAALGGEALEADAGGGDGFEIDLRKLEETGELLLGGGAETIDLQEERGGWALGWVFVLIAEEGGELSLQLLRIDEAAVDENQRADGVGRLAVMDRAR